MEEIEVKFLDVNKTEIENKLKALGAELVSSNIQHSKSFDFEDKRLADKYSWVRLREQEGKVTLAYKERLGVSDNSLKDKGMKEIEINVSEFENTEKLLDALGLIPKFYEEKRRTTYVLDSVTCDIDEWPLIPPYLELEGSSIDELKSVAKKLDLPWEESCMCSAMQVFEKHGIDENSFSVLTFDKQIKK